MLPLSAIIICAMLYAIKGGQHGTYRRSINEKLTGAVYRRQEDSSWQMVAPKLSSRIVDRLLDGKILSSIGFGLLVALHGAEYHGFINGGPSYDLAITAGAVAALGWLAGVAPKMGRIVGDIGGYRGNWNADQEQYIRSEARAAAINGWKAGVQRGVFMGAMLTLATDNLWFIVAGAAYPATVYLGVSIQQKITGKYAADWHWHELLFGAVIGLAFLGV